ncbi:helix-turn-helix transcriptional regulator [Actinoplanes sp. NPDC051475]|uniref:helix-turn-helix domain-containing protein n=1 Tax=Actinoplanes sp. NPDC051475 TaxID=3157225 RepID=UPI00344CB653
MNVQPGFEGPVDPSVWRERPMRLALARRDLGAVFRLLSRRGVTQRQIATLTGQAQSEISEILSGRQVMAYELLTRIADGLGIPHGYLGLSYDPETSAILAAAAGGCPEGDDVDTTRELIAHAAQVTMGAARFDVEHWSSLVPQEQTPGRRRIDTVDVEQLEGITQVLRALDARNGGGSCRDAVLAQVAWAQRGLLGAECTDDVDRRRHLAIADLHNLAGWVSFDIGLYSSANRHYQRALEQASHAKDASLVANILYRMGRLHLHLVDTVPSAERATQARLALKLFQLGQIAAQESGCEVTVAMLCTNEAAAYAALGDERQTLRSLGRAQDEFARGDLATAAKWVRFFGVADLNATTGVAHAALADHLPDRRRDAIEALTRSLASRGTDAARSQAFELTALSSVHLLDGNFAHGAALGDQAVALAERIRSTRVVDRLLPLQRLARRYAGNSDCRELTTRIAGLRAA